MKILNKIIFVILLVFFVKNAFAGNEKFSVTNKPSPLFKLDNQPFVVDDYWDMTNHEYNVSQVKEPLKSTWHKNLKNDSWMGNISLGEGKNTVWAREIAVSNDGKRAEVTFAAQTAPVDHGEKNTLFRYVFKIPCKFLAGAKYEYMVGRHCSMRPPSKGRLNGKEREGKIVIGHIRYIQFTGKYNFMIDFAPCGAWGLFKEDLSSAYKAHVYRKGENYVFVIVNHDARFGKRVSNKVVFRAGKHDLNTIHPVPYMHYVLPFPALTRIHFTPGEPAKGFKTWGTKGFNNDFTAWKTQKAEKGKMGWLELNRASILKPSKKSPIFSGGVLAKGKAVFSVPQQNGLAMVNVLFSGIKGGFDAEIKINNIKQKISLKKGARKTLTKPVYIKDNKLNIEINGKKWLICAIVIQNLMFQEEDYFIKRKWWIFASPLEYPQAQNQLWKFWKGRDIICK